MYGHFDVAHTLQTQLRHNSQLLESNNRLKWRSKSGVKSVLFFCSCMLVCCVDKRLSATLERTKLSQSGGLWKWDTRRLTLFYAFVMLSGLMWITIPQHEELMTDNTEKQKASLQGYSFQKKERFFLQCFFYVFLLCMFVILFVYCLSCCIQVIIVLF